jgi:hypothetical protein
MNPTQPLKPHSGLAVASFIVALVGCIGGIFPFAGVLGIIGLVMAVIDLRGDDPPSQARRHGFATAGVVFGVIATLGVALWTVIFVGLSKSPSMNSCPHLYAFDGTDYRLDADPVSGALFAGGERDDLDRLESLRAVDGEYRVRVLNELQEVDHLDRLQLQVVDHPTGTEVLPTQGGSLALVREAVSPVRATDSAGRDVLDALKSEDGKMVTGAAGTREAWTLEFPRPKFDRALLVVRGHNTPFAQKAFVGYLATMGQGVGPLLEWAQDETCDCHPEYMAEEIKRMGLSLDVSASSGGAFESLAALQPVGPAISRSQALPITLPAGGDRVSIRLETTPLFWEIDQVQLAPAPDAYSTPVVLSPRTAALSTGGDAAQVLSTRDQKRVVLQPGERVDATFDAPPLVPGSERTVVASLRGYYEMEIGGKLGVNPATLVAHRLGWVSLPAFAARLAKP